MATVERNTVKRLNQVSAELICCCCSLARCADETNWISRQAEVTARARGALEKLSPRLF